MKHGTPWTYRNHGCACAECKAAWNLYRREYRLRLREQARKGGHVPHGTVSGYADYACRCEACKVARAESRPARRAFAERSDVCPEHGGAR